MAYSVDPYNRYAPLPDFSMKCINYLIDNDDDIWKLLFYNTPDAWNRPALTKAQKRSLIYAGQEDTTLYRVFLDNGTPDAWTAEDCILRISPYAIMAKNRSVGTVTMLFETYTHYKVNTLSNYRTRNVSVLQKCLEIFNGIEIDGLGKLFFDRMGSGDNRAWQSGQIPYKGYHLLMSTHA